MNIYVYSDESGVFDKKHNDIFVFGGLIILGNNSKEEWSRKYSAAEKVLRNKKECGKSFELKATNVTNGEKGKLFRSLNNCYKFGVIINQNKVLNNIFDCKKSKQRYLDYAYKIAVKRALDMKLFQVKERTVVNADGSVRITKTTKVTGKGQQFFVNLFLRKDQLELA